MEQKNSNALIKLFGGELGVFRLWCNFIGINLETDVILEKTEDGRLIAYIINPEAQERIKKFYRKNDK